MVVTAKKVGPRRYQYVPGDWICPTCEDLQFRRNQSCRICGTMNPMHLAQELAIAAGVSFPAGGSGSGDLFGLLGKQSCDGVKGKGKAAPCPPVTTAANGVMAEMVFKRIMYDVSSYTPSGGAAYDVYYPFPQGLQGQVVPSAYDAGAASGAGAAPGYGAYALPIPGWASMYYPAGWQAEDYGFKGEEVYYGRREEYPVGGDGSGYGF